MGHAMAFDKWQSLLTSVVAGSGRFGMLYVSEPNILSTKAILNPKSLRNSLRQIRLRRTTVCLCVIVVSAVFSDRQCDHEKKRLGGEGHWSLSLYFEYCCLLPGNRVGHYHAKKQVPPLEDIMPSRQVQSSRSTANRSIDKEMKLHS